MIAAEFVINSRPEIVLVPAPVIVSVPVIEGVFAEPPDHAVIFTPGVIVTFSVTDVMRKIVSPEDAADMAVAKVVCVPKPAVEFTIHFDTPKLLSAVVKGIFYPN